MPVDSMGAGAGIHSKDSIKSAGAGLNELNLASTMICKVGMFG